MAIAAANMFTRNIYKEFFRPDATPGESESPRWCRWWSSSAPWRSSSCRTFSIDLQLLGGMWIADPPVRRARPVYPVVPPLGTGGGLVPAWCTAPSRPTRWPPPTTSHWAGSVDIEFGHTVYIGLTAIILNIAVSVILTLIFKATKVPEGANESSSAASTPPT